MRAMATLSQMVPNPGGSFDRGRRGRPARPALPEARSLIAVPADASPPGESNRATPSELVARGHVFRDPLQRVRGLRGVERSAAHGCAGGAVLDDPALLLELGADGVAAGEVPGL